MSSRQNFSLVSGDRRTIGPITVQDEAGVAVNISTVTRIKFRILAQSGGIPSGNDLVVKELPTTWAATTAYALGDFVIPATPNNFSYECTAAGTSAASQPTFPTTLGNTVVDGTVTWTCRELGCQFVTDGTNGQVQIVIGAGETAPLAGVYHHEMRIIEADTDEFPAVMSGLVTIEPDRIVT